MPLGATLTVIRPTSNVQPSFLGGAILEDSSQLSLTSGGKRNFIRVAGKLDIFPAVLCVVAASLLREKMLHRGGKLGL